MKTEEKGVDFWDQKDTELLQYTDLDEAIEGVLDALDSEEELPETLSIWGYVRMEAVVDPKDVLNGILDDLDVDLSDPDGDGTERTKKMEEAAEVFCKVVVSEYFVWACEPVLEKTINVAEWIRKNPRET